MTLIELLLVITLLIISVGVTSDILLSLVRSFSKSQVISEIEQSANFVSLKLEKELRNASSISQLGTTFPPIAAGTASNDLRFIDTQSLDEVRYYVNESTFTISRSVNGGTLYNLTPTTGFGGIKVTCKVTGQCFKLLQAADPQVLQIGIKFEQNTTSALPIFQSNIVIDTAIVLRSSY